MFFLVVIALVNAQPDNWWVKSNVPYISSGNFTEIMEGNRHVVIDFFAPLCKFCYYMFEEWEAVQHYYNNQDSLWFDSNVIITRVNADKEIDIRRKFHVHNYPTIIFVPAGNMQKFERFNGMRLKVEFIKWIDGLMKRHKNYIKPSLSSDDGSQVSRDTQTKGKVNNEGKTSLNENQPSGSPSINQQSVKSKDSTNKVNQNIKEENKGKQDTKDQNKVKQNTEDQNKGKQNTEDQNKGKKNTEDQNKGKQNTKEENKGSQDKKAENKSKDDAKTGNTDTQNPNIVRKTNESLKTENRNDDPTFDEEEQDTSITKWLSEFKALEIEMTELRKYFLEEVSSLSKLNIEIRELLKDESLMDLERFQFLKDKVEEMDLNMRHRNRIESSQTHLNFAHLFLYITLGIIGGILSSVFLFSNKSKKQAVL